MTDPTKANIRVIFALWLVHFTGDLYGSFVSPLLPVFAGVFALSLTEVGIISGLGAKGYELALEFALAQS